MKLVKENHMTPQPTKVRVLVRRTKLTFGLSLGLILAVGCGNKNEVGPDHIDLPNTGTSYIPNLSSNQTGMVQQIKSQIQCRTGGARLSKDYTFRTQPGYHPQGTRTNIYGPFQQGAVSGNVSRLYVGESTFGDLMFVTKVTNGAQVVGYNITLSFCPYIGNDGAPYIHNNRPLEGFAAQNGITLDEDTNCGIGSVDSAQNTIGVFAATTYQHPGGYSVQLPPFNAVTTFHKITAGCNGIY